ncbi:Signal transduction histidine kinase [Polaromonas sp. YR568]|uniref:MASE1 domain-containing protein n=1 Tax=Polaromonas sp. YR568 TaxID=1855301 RepID=UPI0008E7B3E1|nr:MASE1 domain-containing protein [Polaromonas sp. YR568]SFU61234.1 Signal transduction histidine kinase [Polaromonas sp. YR568]
MQRNGHVETASANPAPGNWLALPGLKTAPAPARLGLTALLLACVYALLSTPAAYTSRPDTLAAIIWPAPAVAAALLWNMPYRQWPVFLVAVFLGMLFVGDADPLSVGADAAFSLLNVFEVALYAFLGRRLVCDNGNIDTTARLARFIVLLPLLATALVAALGATIGVVTKHTNWFEEWRVMLVGNGLAILVLLPALLSWCSGHAQAAQSAEKPGTALAAAVLCAGLLAASALIDRFPSEVLRVLLSLVLVWAAIRGGLRAASLGILAAAAVGVGMAMAGYGPYSPARGEEGTWELQVDLAGLAVLSFFVAIAVHERQKLNLRLERARRFETMGFLTGGIAHDFNNILGAVGGYAELAVEREKAGLPVQAALEEVSAAVGRGKDLTEQILIAGRRGARTREAADLRDLIAEAVATVRPLLPPGVELAVKVPAAPVPVLAHRGQLTRAIMNLLRNASQAAAGKVELSLGDADVHAAVYAREADIVVGDVLNEDCVWLDVMDDGAGVPPQHIHQLFDPFFSSRTQQGGSKGHGTGLGLAIVAGVAADHEGGVAVWSGHGQKTRFGLTLPLLQPAEETPAKDQAALQTTPGTPLGSGETAVVIAEDPEARERAEDALALLGFEPAGYAPSGITGLQEPGNHTELLVWIVSPGAPDSLLAGLRERLPGLPLIRCVTETERDGEAPGITQAAGVVTIAGSVDGPAWRQAVKMATGRSDSPPVPHEGPNAT